jgi:3-oxoacyl-[acyl-carrier protein] reductase
MNLGIQGKRALVTASSRGIGESIAIHLAKEGAKVAIVARTKADLKNVFQQIGGKKEGHYMMVCDLTKKDAPRKVIAMIKKSWGEVDILVNNLGDTLELRDPFCPISDWRKLFRINLEVTVELTNLVVRHMQEKKWGRIVNIASTAGMENNGPVPFCTVKAALTAYTRSMGRVLAKTGIVMSALMVGAVYTKGGAWELAMHERPEHVKKYLEDRCPTGKFGEPRDIATMAVVMCSQQAQFCQGSIFPVDGGQSRHYFWSREW